VLDTSERGGPAAINIEQRTYELGVGYRQRVTPSLLSERRPSPWCLSWSTFVLNS
jgi:hypothetical protein